MNNLELIQLIKDFVADETYREGRMLRRITPEQYRNTLHDDFRPSFILTGTYYDENEEGSECGCLLNQVLTYHDYIHMPSHFLSEFGLSKVMGMDIEGTVAEKLGCSSKAVELIIDVWDDPKRMSLDARLNWLYQSLGALEGGE